MRDECAVNDLRRRDEQLIVAAANDEEPPLKLAARSYTEKRPEARRR